MKPADPWTAAQRTAAKAKPPVKLCIVCDEPYTRAYRNIHGAPRLRSPRRVMNRSKAGSRPVCSRSARQAARVSVLIKRFLASKGDWPLGRAFMRTTSFRTIAVKATLPAFRL